MTRYSLLFGFRDVVIGRGFVAGIEVDGRGLLVQEGEGEFVLYGVTPGGVSGVGHDRGSAYADIRENLRGVLFDIAEECATFQVFKQQVETFFHEENSWALEKWKKVAVEAREGKIESDLPKKNHETFRPRIRVVKLEEPQPEYNELDEGARVAV